MTFPQPPRPGQVLAGPLFSEPMRVVTVHLGGAGTRVVGAVRMRRERRRQELEHERSQGRQVYDEVDALTHPMRLKEGEPEP